MKAFNSFDRPTAKEQGQRERRAKEQKMLGPQKLTPFVEELIQFHLSESRKRVAKAQPLVHNAKVRCLCLRQQSPAV
jgi:hypothetical protein